MFDIYIYDTNYVVLYEKSSWLQLVFLKLGTSWNEQSSFQLC